MRTKIIVHASLSEFEVPVTALLSLRCSCQQVGASMPLVKWYQNEGEGRGVSAPQPLAVESAQRSNTLTFASRGGYRWHNRHLNRLGRSCFPGADSRCSIPLATGCPRNYCNIGGYAPEFGASRWLRIASIAAQVRRDWRSRREVESQCHPRCTSSPTVRQQDLKRRAPRETPHVA